MGMMLRRHNLEVKTTTKDLNMEQAEKSAPIVVEEEKVVEKKKGRKPKQD